MEGRSHMSIEVIRPGLLTTVQDLGRPGFQQYGVPVGGAADEVGLRLANMLVGNAEGEAALEITLAGLSLRFDEDTLIAICGADLSPTIDGAPVPAWRPVFVRRGSTLRFEEARKGCRAYIAIAGGLEIPEVMGSRSTYLQGGIGGYHGRALRRGDMLACRTSSTRPTGADLVDRASFLTTSWSVRSEAFYRKSPLLRAIPGPEFGSFTPASREIFFSEAFEVTSRSDRIGCRLSGPMLRLAAPMEMISEGVATGTVQVPADGNPILLMPDRQTVGGYPVIAQIASVDLPSMAQLMPGDRIRFRMTSVEVAQHLYHEREAALRRLKVVLRVRSY
jgi:antagonist of KipI